MCLMPRYPGIQGLSTISAIGTLSIFSPRAARLNVSHCSFRMTWPFLYGWKLLNEYCCTMKQNEDPGYSGDHGNCTVGSATAACQWLSLGAFCPNHRRGGDGHRDHRFGRNGRRRRIGGGRFPLDEELPLGSRSGAPRGDALPDRESHGIAL